MRLKLLLLAVSFVTISACVRSRINRVACTVPASQLTVSDSCLVSAPNIFTPNGDGINDAFGPLTSCDFESFQMTIFDNGGIPVYFQSSDAELTWDGIYEGDFVVGEVSFQMLFVINGVASQLDGRVTVLPYATDAEQPFKIANCFDCRFPDQADVNGEFVLGTREPVVNICD